MAPDFTKLPVSIYDIRTARSRIAPHILETPLVENGVLSQEYGCRLAFKCENLQHSGVFKTRGASNAVFSLGDDEARRGVLTHSSGNHAAALSRAAMRRGIPAHIVMPRNSRENKIAAVRAFGIDPVLCEPDAGSRQQTAEEVEKKTGATLIHPYNNPTIIAGQGTVGLEIVEQFPEVDMVVVPVGGGGLLSGILIAVKSLRPHVKVFAAEPAWADDAARSLRSGRIEMPTRYDTIADGLRTPLGDLTFEVIRELVDGILLVDEKTIVNATRLIAAKARLVAEPSGAVPLAAVIQHPSRFQGKNTVAVISGGNLDFSHFDLAP